MIAGPDSIVKVPIPVVPDAGFVTLRFLVPIDAVDAMVRGHMIWLAVLVVYAPIVTPVPATVTVAVPGSNPVPVIVRV